MTDSYKTAVIELKLALTTDATNYTAELFRLLMKADAINYARLKSVYPEYVQAYDDWKAAPNEFEFFKNILDNET